nr:LysR family transcriptional regulator [uncultured Halomonas sp.]
MNRTIELDTLCAVIEAGSITAAARRLDTAKSVVSRRIKDLEQRLKVELFHRTTRQLMPTETGLALYRRARYVLDELQDAETAATGEHAAIGGRLKVAVPASFGALHVAPALGDLMTRYPALNLELDVNDRRLDLVAEGIDVALRIGGLLDSTFIAKRITRIRHLVCAAPSYLERHGTPKRLEDLSQHHCLSYSGVADATSWPYLRDKNAPGRVPINVRLRANNGDILREAALAGLGLIREPTFIVWRHIQTGGLVPVLTEYTWSRVHLQAVWPQTRHPSRRVRAFVDFFAERFNDPPYWDEPYDRIS